MSEAVFDPGRLNRRLVLEAPVDAPDGAGGQARTYTSVATLWAEVTPLAPRGDVEAESLGGVAAYRILVRAPCAATTRHRFILGDRTLRILDVRDPFDSGRFVEMRAEERVA